MEKDGKRLLSPLKKKKNIKKKQPDPIPSTSSSYISPSTPNLIPTDSEYLAIPSTSKDQAIGFIILPSRQRIVSENNEDSEDNKISLKRRAHSESPKKNGREDIRRSSFSVDNFDDKNLSTECLLPLTSNVLYRVKALKTLEDFDAIVTITDDILLDKSARAGLNDSITSDISTQEFGSLPNLSSVDQCLKCKTSKRARKKCWERFAGREFIFFGVYSVQTFYTLHYCDLKNYKNYKIYPEK